MNQLEDCLPATVKEPVGISQPTLIQVIDYDLEEETLRVEFEDHRRLEYEGVPVYLYHGLMESGAKLQYLQDHVVRAGYASRIM